MFIVRCRWNSFLPSVTKELAGLLFSIHPRQTRLGFIQRGGSPTYRDRLLACRLGVAAVDLLMQGKSNRVVFVRQSAVMDMDLREALKVEKSLMKTYIVWYWHWHEAASFAG